VESLKQNPKTQSPVKEDVSLDKELQNFEMSRMKQRELKGSMGYKVIYLV